MRLIKVVKAHCAPLSARHGLRTPREEMAFTAQPKIHSHSQIFRYGESIFCLPHRPNFSDIFDLCLHWVSVVRGARALTTAVKAQMSQIFCIFVLCSELLSSIRVHLLVEFLITKKPCRF